MQKKLQFATKGEKFLEFKREQIIRQIKETWEEYLDLRAQFLDLYRKSLITLNRSYKEMGKRDFILISNLSQIQYHPLVSTAHIKKLGITTSHLDISLSMDNKLPTYGFDDSSHFLDDLVLILIEFLHTMKDFAVQEDLLLKSSQNFNKVNRRINGLKNVVIPQLRLDIKKIKEKLEEYDRENFVRLKKTKDLIEKKVKVK